VLHFASESTAGRLVHIQEVIERRAGDVFRCVCRNSLIDRVQELPVWMFDRATCATVRVLAKPLVELSALRGLGALLTDTTKDRTLADSGLSNTPVLGASMGSHD